MDRGKEVVEGSSRSGDPPPTPSRYESQKRRDWNTFGQYLRNQRPPVSLSQCNSNHVLEFLRYLDQFGKTKVHMPGCIFYGEPEPPAPCTCPLRQAWGSLDALIGRLRAAYEENGGSSDTNPFASSAIRVYLREVKECQAKARGIPYKKKKRRVKEMMIPLLPLHHTSPDPYLHSLQDLDDAPSNLKDGRKGWFLYLIKLQYC